MRIMVIQMFGTEVTIAFKEAQIFSVADMLEKSETVISYHVQGLQSSNQQASFGARNFKKWESPISQ